MNWSLVLIIVLAGILLAAVLLRKLGSRFGIFGRLSGGREKERLLRMCFGDRDTVERLIKLERDRDKNISEKEACIRAAERLRRHKS